MPFSYQIAPISLRKIPFRVVNEKKYSVKVKQQKIDEENFCVHEKRDFHTFIQFQPNPSLL